VHANEISRQGSNLGGEAFFGGPAAAVRVAGDTASETALTVLLIGWLFRLLIEHEILAPAAPMLPGA
jgi:hypothetical protein